MKPKISYNQSFEDIDVLMLCGGIGSRLQKVINDRPKPMASIGQNPFLDILIDYFASFGFRRFILCTGYMSEVIERYYCDKLTELEIVFSNETVPLGTAGAVKNAEKVIRSETFLVANGDSLCQIELNKFFDFHMERQAMLSIAVADSKGTEDVGSIGLGAGRKITGFQEKKKIQGQIFINTGIYLFEKRVLSYIAPAKQCSLEYELFPQLIGQECYGYLSDAKLFDIGTPERLELARESFAAKLIDISAPENLKLTRKSFIANE